jgi:L-arabinose 1- dehydrogenase
MSKNKLNFGLVGLGGISKYFIAALEKNTSSDLVAVCTKSRKNNPSLYEIDTAKVSLFTNYNDFLTTSNLDVVIIAAPNYTHYDLIKTALVAGKHVGCEKPLVVKENEYLNLVELAMQHNKVLFGIYHRRYNNSFSQLRTQLEGEKIIAITMRYLENIEQHSGNSSWYFDPQKSGGGCLIDNGVNCIDTLLTLVGDLVFTSGKIGFKTKLDKRHDASAVLHFTTPKNIDITLELDWYFNGEQKDISVYTESGKVYHCDFLSEWPGFKNSLWHEYEKALQELIELTKVDKPFIDEASQKNITIVAQIYQKLS